MILSLFNEFLLAQHVGVRLESFRLNIKVPFPCCRDKINTKVIVPVENQFPLGDVMDQMIRRVVEKHKVNKNAAYLLQFRSELHDVLERVVHSTRINIQGDINVIHFFELSTEPKRYAKMISSRTERWC